MNLGRGILTDAATHIWTASAQWDKALGDLSEVSVDGASGFDQEKPFADLHIPPSLVGLRLRTIAALLGGLPDDLPLSTVPLSVLNEILGGALQLRELMNGFVAHMNSVRTNGGFKSIDWNDIHIANLDGRFDVPLIPNVIQPFLEQTDYILVRYNQLLPVIAPGSLDFRYVLESAAKADERSQEAAENAGRSAQAAASAAQQAAEYSGAANQSAMASSGFEADVKKIRDSLAVMEGDTVSKKAQADATLTAASALKVQVDEYEANFEAFQRLLDQRTASWTKGQGDLAVLMTDLQGQRNTIEAVIRKASDMLATATNAGLTAAQETRYSELATELRTAGGGVNWSFGLLFLSVSPLIAYVVGNWNTTIPFSGGLEYAANIGLRAFLLVPALLWVGFTTFRYRRLFRLKHEYGFRASLAGAVEGFKTQAPTHGEDIAAVAFYQLGRNPAEAIDKDQATPEWYEKLSAIIERFGDKFGKSTKP